MKLTSMKITAAEQKAREAEYSKPMPEQDRYPYGLSISLENDAIEKLDLDELPAIGAKLELAATVEVTGASSHSTTGGGKRRSVSLQITALGLSKPAGDKATKLYGG